MQGMRLPGGMRLPTGGGGGGAAPQGIPGLGQLQSFTGIVNVFNQFFHSINWLFRNLRLLQNNIVNSVAIQLMIVAALLLYCVYLLYPCCILHDRFGTDESVDRTLRDAGPIVLVCAIIGGFYYMRVRSDRTEQTEQHGRPNDAAADLDDERDDGPGARPQPARPREMI